MPQFAPDQVTFKDFPGLGVWDIGHAREHQQFVEVLSEQVPTVLIPNFDFLQMLTAGNSSKSVIETHNEAHNLLRSILNITGTDYSQYDLTNESDFYNFTAYHATEHQQIRAALGITT